MAIINVLNKYMTDKLINETIEKIKQQKIVPQAKWMYMLKRYLKWFAFALTICLSAISLSVIFFVVVGLDWDLHRFMQMSQFHHAFLILPRFWILLVILLMIIAFFEMRKTDVGYRYSWQKILVISVGMAAVFTILFSFAGMGKRFNSTAANKIPGYGRHIITKETQWMQPEKGLLAGTVKDMNDDVVILKDLQGENREVVLNENTFIRPMAKINKDEMIKIIGKNKDGRFYAIEIRPWIGKGERRMMQR